MAQVNSEKGLCYSREEVKKLASMKLQIICGVTLSLGRGTNTSRELLVAARNKKGGKNLTVTLHPVTDRTPLLSLPPDLA